MIFSLLITPLVWQVPASFSYSVSTSAEDQYFLHNFYVAETTPDGLSYRWGSTGASFQLPPLSADLRVKMRLVGLPPEIQPDRKLVVKVDGKEVSRFNLETGPNDYQFQLDKKLAGLELLKVELVAAPVLPPNDPRLLTIGFSQVQIETSPGLNLPPIGSYLTLWLTGLLFFVAVYFQRPRLTPLLYLILQLGLVLLLLWVTFQRPAYSYSWLVLLLALTAVAAGSFLVRPNNPPDQYREYLVLILAVAALVRLYNLDMSPLGILNDEATLGYDAFSILHTGRDQHGIFLPLYFRTFNDFPPGVANYIALPFVAIFGLNLGAIRLPFALLGVGTTWFSLLLATELCRAIGIQKARQTGLLAGLFVAVSPCAVSQSRIALPVATLSFFFLGGLWLALRGKRENHWASWVGSGLLLGVAVWTYPTMKLFMFLFVAGLLIFFAPFFRKNWRQFLIWGSSFSLVCLPFTIANIIDWSEINYRFTYLSVWYDTDFWGGLGKFLGNYLAHYDPLRLFFKLTGDYAVVVSSRPTLTGVVSPILAIPVVVGLLVSFKWRKNPAIWLLWLWFLLFPLGSALTNEEVPNEIRAMSGVGLFEIFAALGCWWLWQKLGQFWAKNPSARFAIGSLGGLVFSVVTLTYLFYTLAIAPTEIRPLFRYGFGETLAAAEEIAPPSAEICVEQTSQSYMLTLFYTRYDPAKYQDFIRNNEPPLKVIYFIPSFDRYRFNCDPTKDLKPGDVGLIRTQTGKLPIRWQIFYPNNRKAWAIVQLP